MAPFVSTALCACSVPSQFSEIDAFTSDVGLGLNVCKLEIIHVSQTPT